MENLIDRVRMFLIDCPLLKDGVMNVDYLGIAPTGYSVDTLPADPILKEYIDGSSIRQFVFAFGSAAKCGLDVGIKLVNSSFYGDFAAWMERKSENEEFPAIGENRTPIEIEAQGAGYVLENTENGARFQVQCRLVYLQKGE